MPSDITISFLKYVEVLNCLSECSGVKPSFWDKMLPFEIYLKKNLKPITLTCYNIWLCQEPLCVFSERYHLSSRWNHISSHLIPQFKSFSGSLLSTEDKILWCTCKVLHNMILRLYLQILCLSMASFLCSLHLTWHQSLLTFLLKHMYYIIFNIYFIL